MDGKTIYNGRVIPLGNRGYSVGFASANSGSAYTGNFDTDVALLDRMHMIVNVTHPDFFPTSEDVFDIFSGNKKNPRASMPDSNSLGLTDGIIAMHEEFKQRPASAMLCVMAPYFNIGLDYILGTTKHSKRALEDHWPNVQGLRTDVDEDKIYPLSKRAIFGALALTSGLEMIAEESGRIPQGSNMDQSKAELELFLDALKLTIPFSGIISPQFIPLWVNTPQLAAINLISF